MRQETQPDTTLEIGEILTSTQFVINCTHWFRVVGKSKAVLIAALHEDNKLCVYDCSEQGATDRHRYTVWSTNKKNVFQIGIAEVLRLSKEQLFEFQLMILSGAE